MRYEQANENEQFSNFPQFSFAVERINEQQYKDLSRGGVYVSPWASDLLYRLVPESERQEQVLTVKFHLRDVGIRDYMSGREGWDEVVQAVKEKGLDLLPQLTAPELALLNADIIGEGEYVDVLSEPIMDRNGDRDVFGLERYGGELKLHGRWTGDGWNPGGLAVARLR